MKKRDRVFFILLTIIGLVLISINCCKKDNSVDTKNTIKDIEGNVYHTVTIGTQVWMSENLNVAKYRNGESIGTTTPLTLPTQNSELRYKYEWVYYDNSSNSATYGRLYTWNVITDSRNVCPEGWHIPSNDEWITLEDYVKTQGYAWNGRSDSDDFAQSLASDTGWKPFTEPGCAVGYNDINKMNLTGFSALPGGIRDPGGLCFSGGAIGYFWTSTGSIDDSGSAYGRIIYYDNCYVRIYQIGKNSGLSVRCLKD